VTCDKNVEISEDVKFVELTVFYLWRLINGTLMMIMKI
jgi:hypothetical protein